MSVLEVIVGGALVVVLVGLAGYFSWQQKKTLGSLKAGSTLAVEDRRYLRKQAFRRILCSCLMVVIAGLLVGSVFLDDLVRGPPLNQEQIDRGVGQIDKEKREIARAKIVYWAVILMVVFGLFFLAVIDLMATARFGFRHHRQLEAEKNAVLEEELSRWRGKST